MNPFKATGLDGVSSRFLRDAAVLVEPISHMVNLSIITETVPRQFKQAKVIPLFKKGSTLDPGNYRPVSLLPVLSKILERAVDGQLKQYLEKKKILSNKQSGFRSRFSTDTCLIGLSDSIRNEVSRGNMVGMVLIDLRKAFDTVDFEILLSKLDAIGVTCVAWFRSYLFGREQCVEVDGIRSNFLQVSCGVPQGSILGPQLFLLYINDLSISVDCDLSLYADDSALIFAHQDPIHIANHLSAQLDKCKEWLTDNRLSLHVGKTESILFGSKRKLKRVNGYQVMCERTPVKQVTSVCYLGVLLNDSLDGKSQADNVIRKCGGRIAFLFRHGSILNFQARKVLCSTLVQPFLDYCSSSWYFGLTKQLKSKLDVLQRKMIRFIFSMHFLDHVDPSRFAELSWLTVKDRVRFFQLCHVFRIKMGKAPSYMCEYFSPVSSLHSHSTRGSHAHNYFVSPQVSRMPDSFAYSAIREWNALPVDLKCIERESNFKRKLKAYFSATYK